MLFILCIHMHQIYFNKFYLHLFLKYLKFDRDLLGFEGRIHLQFQNNTHMLWMRSGFVIVKCSLSDQSALLLFTTSCFLQDIYIYISKALLFHPKKDNDIQPSLLKLQGMKWH